MCKKLDNKKLGGLSHLVKINKTVVWINHPIEDD